MLGTVGPKESNTPQLYPVRVGAALAHREWKACAVRQVEVFLVWSKWLRSYWCRVGFGATSVEAPPFKWKVQCWESAGNAWSQQWALARAAGEAGSCTIWLSSVGLSSDWQGSRGTHPAVPATGLLSPGAAVSYHGGPKVWAMVWGFVFSLLLSTSSCQLIHLLNPGRLGPSLCLFLGNLLPRREEIGSSVSDILAAL